MASSTQGKLGQAEMWQETTGVQMGLESFAEWCSWELRMDVSVVEKEKATRSNDYWGCNFIKWSLQIHDLKKLCR